MISCYGKPQTVMSLLNNWLLPVCFKLAFFPFGHSDTHTLEQLDLIQGSLCVVLSALHHLQCHKTFAAAQQQRNSNLRQTHLKSNTRPLHFTESHKSNAMRHFVKTVQNHLVCWPPHHTPFHPFKWTLHTCNLTVTLQVLKLWPWWTSSVLQLYLTCMPVDSDHGKLTVLVIMDNSGYLLPCPLFSCYAHGIKWPLLIPSAC